MLEITTVFDTFSFESRKLLRAQEIVLRHVYCNDVGEPNAEACFDIALKDALSEARGGSCSGPTGSVGEHLDLVIGAAERQFSSYKEQCLLSCDALKKIAVARAELDGANASDPCKECPSYDPCRAVARAMPPANTLPSCLVGLHELIAIASEFAKRVYEKYFPELDIELLTLFKVRREDERSSDARAFLEHKHHELIRSISVQIKRRVEIELLLPVKRLDEISLFSVPYILAHELAVHGLEGALGTERPLALTKISKFAEGLVDLVIHKEFQQFVSDGRARRLGDYGRIATATMVRHSQRPANGTQIKRAVTLGTTAYGILSAIGRRFCRVQGIELDPWVRKVVLALNLLDLTETDHDRFFKALGVIQLAYENNEESLDWPPQEQMLHDPFWIMARALSRLQSNGPTRESRTLLLKAIEIVNRLGDAG
ncbi:MAG: hypothetical protein WAZ27_00360 [Minisyncoccia bacterium]